MIKNTASQRVGAQMVTAADGTAFAGAVTVSVTIDAGAQATGSVGAGACTHEGNGYHTYAPAQAETNGDLVAFTFTGTGAVPATVQIYTWAGDAFTRLGAPAGASVSADLAAVKVDTAAILVDTGTTLDGRIPAALVSGRMDASVGAMAANVLTATAINADAITAAKIADGAIDAATFAAGAINAAAIAADAITDAKVAADVTIASVTGAVGSVTGLTAATVHADLDDLQARLPAALVSGRMDASVGAMAANVMTAAAAAADLTTELQSGLATAANLATVAGYLDTEIAAILADTNELQTDWANGGRLDLILDAASAPTAAAVADAVWDEALAGHAGAGSAGEALAAAGTAGDPWTTAVPGAYGAGTAGKIIGDNLNATISSRASQASLDTLDDLVDTEVAAIKTDTAAILVDTGTTLDGRIPAALVGGRMDASVGAMAANVLTAAAFADDAIEANSLHTDVSLEIAQAVWNRTTADHTNYLTFGGRLKPLAAATAQAGAAGTITLNGVTASTIDDFYNNALIVITGATGAGQARTISDYVGATKVASVEPDWVTNPAASSEYIIIPMGAVAGATAPTASDVADAVWDATVVGHTDSGSFGEATANIDFATNTILFTDLPAVKADTAAIAALPDAIWDEATSGHTTAGSYGDKLGAHLPAILKVIVGAGSTTTAIVLNAVTGIDGAAPSAVDDFYSGRVIVFTSGALAGQATSISDYDGATGTLTVVALTGAPAAAVTAVIA
jgi:hypothetical protein